MHDNCFVKILISEERLKWKRYSKLMAQTPSVLPTQTNHLGMKIITQTIVLIMRIRREIKILFDNFNRRALRCFNLQLL
jgi:hypothetical protein